MLGTAGGGNADELCSRINCGWLQRDYVRTVRWNGFEDQSCRIAVECVRIS